MTVSYDGTAKPLIACLPTANSPVGHPVGKSVSRIPLDSGNGFRDIAQAIETEK